MKYLKLCNFFFFFIDFHFSFDGKPGAIQVDLWDEDSLLKSDKDDLVGVIIGILLSYNFLL
jgi:hypothetical protein